MNAHIQSRKFQPEQISSLEFFTNVGINFISKSFTETNKKRFIEHHSTRGRKSERENAEM